LLAGGARRHSRAVRFELEQYLSAPLTEVEAAYLDPALLERLAGLPNVRRPELLEQHEEDGLVRRRVRFRFTGDLSSAVTSVVDPARLTWVEESVHDRSTHRGRFTIVPDHYAGRLRCSGTVTFREDAGGGTQRLTAGELSVRFPLVGSKVERAIVSGLREHAAAEARAVQAWLDGARQ
jgi:hypothetical protein